MALSFTTTPYALRNGMVVAPEPGKYGTTLYCTYSVLEDNPNRGFWAWLRGRRRLAPDWQRVSVRGAKMIPDKVYLPSDSAKAAIAKHGDPATVLYTYHCRANGATRWHLITVGTRARRITREDVQHEIAHL